MDSDAKEPTGVTRGQNVVHVMPLDWSATERVLAPLVDRLDPERAETQLLVVTADAEGAASAAAAIVSAIGDRLVQVVAATGSPRAARLLKASPAQVVTGAPTELAALLQSSALKPESVRGILFAWLDPILETPEALPLETLLGELPKDAARVVLAAEVTPALEALIERYARRARRAVESPEAGQAPLTAEYVTGAVAARVTTLRRLLDALDLPRAVLYARTEQARRDAAGVARSLGYSADAVRLHVEGPATKGGDPLVMVELPASQAELRALVGTTGRKLYAVVQPSQLASLRVLLGGGVATPVALIEAAERARGRDASMRASLRDVLTSADLRREVLALEPLLVEFDGIEIAAAALRMLEQQRPARPVHSATHATPMQKLFVNLGEKDGVRAAELIAVITTEAGIPGSQVGKVEVRDTHSIVEVATSVAELVVEKLGGANVRGRRVQARLDTPRGERPERSGPPPRSFDRGERPARPSFDRGERPDRGDRPDRGARPARPYGAAPRGDRPDRGAPPRGDRPARPFNGPPRKFDRGEGAPARPPRPPRPRRDDA